MSNINLVIFDCDGVLVDSEIISTKVETELLRSAGFEISIEHLTERFSGMSWKDILLILEHESGLSLMDALLDKTETELDTRLPEQVKAIDGVRAVLQGLQYQRCVCSNTKRPRIEAMLTKVRLKEFFGSAIFSAKDLGDGRAKPRPDVFLFGAQRMGFDPSQTVVVEDSVHGVQAAHTAGMKVIGFTGGSHTYPDHAENLRDAGALTVVSQMCDLPGTLADIANRYRH
jgi:HAD superfamily hydrolase (TIGR01509 family)